MSERTFIAYVEDLKQLLSSLVEVLDSIHKRLDTHSDILTKIEEKLDHSDDAVQGP